ncbi:MAG: phospho-N-acetylmuramoyl-pentapeptide-transferase [Treponema phagedenis]|uniref:phospho-N-acetylmuramoyl-pentapeptide- transferase n=1 Tax=Treponema phagedenis TaxID=162 RepID=UPI003133FD95
MFFYLSGLLSDYFGPMRLLQSYMVLISIAFYLGFFLTVFILPYFYGRLPKDRGREFTVSPEAAKGKPTGGGAVFITIFVAMIFVLIIPSITQILVLLLTWLVMLTGYLDDRSLNPWGEYRKGALDLILSLITAGVLFHFYFHDSISYWIPFISTPIAIHPALFFFVSVMVLWFSINTTNCTDGVDGLSGTLILTALISLGTVFYFIIGNVKVSEYLLVPHRVDGAQWALICFSLSGVLMGYLWHNAYPSTVLMGDAGSRALGFFIGVLVIISGNPFLLLMTSGMILLNGGTGLVKVALLRFFHIRIFRNIRFPLHDHMRKNLKWSPTQVLIKFLILQLLITLAVFALLFKIR